MNKIPVNREIQLTFTSNDLRFAWKRAAFPLDAQTDEPKLAVKSHGERLSRATKTTTLRRVRLEFFRAK